MRRYPLFKKQNEKLVGIGTGILFPSELLITLHPLEEFLGTSEFFISFTGLEKDAERITSISEYQLGAPGIPLGSAAPYAYQITLG